MFRRTLAVGLGGLAILAAAQNCTNYGAANGSACACPIGYGGADCSTPACGGTLFQGSARPLVSLSGPTDYGNITASGCSCENGWTGEGCNVCQSASACASAYAAVATLGPGAVAGSAAGVGGNNTMVCNASPRVYAAGQMSCSVNNPTLQSQFPGRATLNIMRTLDQSLTPLPNVSAFGAPASVYAQLLHDGVEQFFCRATSCTQALNASDTGAGGADWTCADLACSCRAGTTFCGGAALSIANVINGLTGPLTIACAAPGAGGSATCAFKQSTLDGLFGPAGLALQDCAFGECVRQGAIDTAATNGTVGPAKDPDHLSAGVVAGLAVVGALLALVLLLLAWGLWAQRRARRGASGKLAGAGGGVGVEWEGIEYVVPTAHHNGALFRRRGAPGAEKTVLDRVSGRVAPGETLAILGPSGAGKTSLIEILAGKAKAGRVAGRVAFPGAPAGARGGPRIGFVPQQDVLPASLGVREALLFAARLRLPEHVSAAQRAARVEDVIEQLGLAHVAGSRIGSATHRGISGGEARRVSIGLELVGAPDVLVLDEPTSGLDSVSAARVVAALVAVARAPERPTAVLASLHQPSSRLYASFDRVALLAHGRALYSGPGGLAPTAHFARSGHTCPAGYNVADWLLELASDAPVSLFTASGAPDADSGEPASGKERLHEDRDALEMDALEMGSGARKAHGRPAAVGAARTSVTFLTQLQVLCGREWKVLLRDKTTFLAHVAIAAVLGAFVGGLYYHTGITIAGFQSRVGCLFFLGALIAFSTLSALYSVVESRPLFVRERSNGYYSPAAWLLSRLLFDLIPLRIVPTIVVGTITYWMAGLAPDAAHFFKFLLILVLYTIAMTLWNYLLGALLPNAGLAILLSALSALYQMTFAGFFVHLASIPGALRWLQWLCPLKYALEALAVNEVGAGLMISDTLSGVPVNVSAALIMGLLFGFEEGSYYRDVLVHVAFVLGFGVAVVGVVWWKVRERR